jgi:glyoxylase I family protein
MAGALIKRWRHARGLSYIVRMKLEHFALQVPEPVAMGDWYVKHLGATVARAGGAPQHGRFLKVGGVLFEIYNNPAVTMPDYSKIDVMQLHLAFSSENLKADRDRLLMAGARVAVDIYGTPEGDEIMMLRDPWNVPIQFVKRKEPMM